MRGSKQQEKRWADQVYWVDLNWIESESIYTLENNTEEENT